MTSRIFKTIACLFVCLSCGTCDLDLSEGSACVSEGLNGTCVSVFRCMSAALHYIYRNAGFREEHVPTFPDVCTYKDGYPVVCCADCKIYENEEFRNNVINIFGGLVTKDGPKAEDKCLDYLQYLPYKCRGYISASSSKVLDEKQQCYEIQVSNWQAIGGREAERWEFPHMALLGFGDTQQTAEWQCGGTVISEWFILTAGHCVYSDALKSNVSFAALGLLKRSDPLEYWKIYKIKRFFRHPQYKPPSRYHDIALLETETEINFSRYLLPACLDTVKTVDLYKFIADASGWGELGHRNALADTLQVVTLQEFGESECSTHFPVHRHLKQGYNHSSQMCYGSHLDVIDTCRGDSGGPLQINIDRAKCQYTVIGVTSFGQGSCGVTGVPTIYTRVSHYVPWIESIVWPD